MAGGRPMGVRARAAAGVWAHEGRAAVAEVRAFRVPLGCVEYTCKVGQVWELHLSQVGMDLW